jgi:hypothetical protein
MTLTEDLREALQRRVPAPEPAFRQRARRSYTHAVERHLRRRQLKAVRRQR